MALEALRAASALNRTQVKKALPRDYQSHHAEILDTLRQLAIEGKLERWQKGKTEWFFATDPVAASSRTARNLLAAGPLSPEDLQKRLEAETKIPKAYFQEWRRSALARGELFEVRSPANAGGKASRLLSLEPDLRASLKKVLAELEKARDKLEPQGVTKERIARFLLEELGVALDTPGAAPAGRAPAAHSPASSAEGPQDDRALFLDALRRLTSERRAGALLLVSELRERTSLDKTRFDRIALELAREALIDLHYHDHPQALDAAERERLVRDDAGTHYVGIALRPAR